MLVERVSEGPVGLGSGNVNEGNVAQTKISTSKKGKDAVEYKIGPSIPHVCDILAFIRVFLEPTMPMYPTSPPPLKQLPPETICPALV